MLSALPDGDANGMTSLARILLEEPEQTHVVIAVVNCKKSTTDYDKHTREAYARVIRIEPINDAEDVTLAEQLMRRGLERRTGQETLPLEMEDEITSLFAEVLRGDPTILLGEQDDVPDADDTEDEA